MIRKLHDGFARLPFSVTALACCVVGMSVGIAIGAGGAAALDQCSGHCVYGDGNNNVSGSPNFDLIETGGGNDDVRAHGAHDDVKGQGNQDYLNGNDGPDEIDGGSGSDQFTCNSPPFDDCGLQGNDGNDDIFGGDGGDTLKGNSGNDLLYGGSSRDTHHDHCYPGPGPYTIIGCHIHNG